MVYSIYLVLQVHRSSSLFLREEQDESHGDEDDEVGEDVEPEEGIGLLGVGPLPRLVPEEQDQRVDGLGVQPPAADREGFAEI